MIDKEKFEAYEAVRTSWVTNMFDVRFVCELSSLTRDEVKDIMKNYTEYSEKYGDKKWK